MKLLITATCVGNSVEAPPEVVWYMSEQAGVTPQAERITWCSGVDLL
jgi:hypothetical protein